MNEFGCFINRMSIYRSLSAYNIILRQQAQCNRYLVHGHSNLIGMVYNMAIRNQIKLIEDNPGSCVEHRVDNYRSQHKTN